MSAIKLIKNIYHDIKGNEWIIERHELPKKKGVYKFWIAECLKSNKVFKDKLKRDVIKQIKNFIQ